MLLDGLLLANLLCAVLVCLAVVWSAPLCASLLWSAPFCSGKTSSVQPGRSSLKFLVKRKVCSQSQWGTGLYGQKSPSLVVLSSCK